MYVSECSTVFAARSTKIDSLLQKYPAAEVAVFGDVHNREWLTLVFIFVAPTLQVW